MKKVHVVFKTHLDLGFTDLASNVLENYNNNYIPRALDLAYELNESEVNPKFIWTTGSYLIWQYLKSQSECKANKMIEAIKKGYISWHGIPVTFHSEAAGKLVFEEALNMTKELDERFNKVTRSGKMTDVPGHTKTIVPLLAKNGIKFMHVGMNGVSAIPDLPDNFIWECAGSSIIVAYSHDYGTDIKIDGCDDILVFAHTHDNSGPQSKEKILKVYEDLAVKYPGYEICASTMDNYVMALEQSKLNLPVVSEEIGDTWIHGIASDAKKMRDYNILINLINEWLEKGTVSKNDEWFYDVIYELMLVPEHTWGMDIKRYFSDYKHYTKEEFNKAREKNTITDEVLTFRYGDIGIATKPEMEYTNFEWKDRTYSLYESSWKEQRLYIDNAINMLPQDLKQITLKQLQEYVICHKGQKVSPYQEIEIEDYKIKINEHGAINSLIVDEVQYASNSNELGKLQYTVLGNDSYEKLRRQYLRDMDKHFWAVDFLKPGIELQNEIVNTVTYDTYVKAITRSDNKVIVELYISDEATDKFGAPQTMFMEYVFADSLEINIKLSGKDAIRYPEIISLGFNPLVNNKSRYKIEKLGQQINPLDVVANGNKSMHSLDDKISYDATDKRFVIKAVDSKIVSIGKIDNLDFGKYDTNINNGFYFHLLNTTWGTNFTMWYEDDIHARFKIIFNRK